LSTSTRSLWPVRYPALRGAARCGGTVCSTMIAGGRRLIQAYTRPAMADRAPKRKTNAKRDSPGVLGTLPASRPERIGRPRRGGAEPKPKAKPRPPAAKRRAKPEAVSPGCPPLATTRAGEPPPPRPIGAPTGTELVTTTIRAAGELAQIGFVVGGQVLKRTLRRLPHP
jgi:hypothetical protein